MKNLMKWVANPDKPLLITGPKGSGKTTLARMLANYDHRKVPVFMTEAMVFHPFNGYLAGSDIAVVEIEDVGATNTRGWRERAEKRTMKLRTFLRNTVFAEEISIEMKGKNPATMKNHLTWIIVAESLDTLDDFYRVTLD